MTTYEHNGITQRLERLKKEYEDKIIGVLRATPINEHHNILEMIEPYMITLFGEMPTDIYKLVSASYKHETTKHYPALGLVEQDIFSKEWFTRQMELKLDLEYHKDLLYIAGGELKI